MHHPADDNPQRKQQIAIIGAGGVGGYIGALLARKYSGSPALNIQFILRSSTAERVRNAGLQLTTDDENILVHPQVYTASDNLPPIDYLICCTKSYDLETSLTSLASCIHSGTVILPLFNGVDAVDRIRKLFPDAEVWTGCIYLVSAVVEPGVVRKSGKAGTLFLGAEGGITPRMEQLQQWMQAAGIDARVPEDIHAVAWEKFIFIAPLASLGSYTGWPVGKLLQDMETAALLWQLVEECTSVGRALGVPLPENIVEKTMGKFAALPPDTTTSMQRDFSSGNPTEYESLTGYVCHQAVDNGLPMPGFNRIYAALKVRING